MMKLCEKTKMNGYLSIFKVYEDGTQECVLDNDPNTITYDSRRLHLQYLYDYANAPRDQISTFKVGTGGAVGDDQGGNANVKVLTPDPTRNDLFIPVSLPNDTIVMTPSDPNANEVFLQIIFTLSQDEANGFQINECGLFKESNNMFNHKTFINIEKTEAFSLVFDWKLRYV